jgi:hypothetical protein
MGMYVNKITRINNLIISVQLFVEKLWARNRQIHWLQISFFAWGSTESKVLCVKEKSVVCKNTDCFISEFVHDIYEEVLIVKQDR